MAWTAPTLRTTGDLETASSFNTDVLQNLIYLFNALNVVNTSEFSAGNTGSAITINFTTNGFSQKATRNANTTITLTAPPTVGVVTLKLVHDATANVYTVAFSPAVKWSGGVAPTFSNTASAIDIVTLYWDGTTWFGNHQAAFA